MRYLILDVKNAVWWHFWSTKDLSDAQFYFSCEANCNHSFAWLEQRIVQAADELGLNVPKAEELIELLRVAGDQGRLGFRALDALVELAPLARFLKLDQHLTGSKPKSAVGKYLLDLGLEIKVLHKE